jgi:hypothetical protein
MAELESKIVMPHKFNAARRHHIPQMQFKVRNWAEYEAGLRRRGSLTLWISEEAIADWHAALRTTPSGQATYSDTAIQACLMLRAGFKMPLRQAGVLSSNLRKFRRDAQTASNSPGVSPVTASAEQTPLPSAAPV